MRKDGIDVRMWRSLEDVPQTWGPAAVTIGVFDGVHRGHQALIAATVRSAAAADVSAVVLTFDPHPLAVLRPEARPRLLTTAEQRAELMSKQGVSAVLVLPFDREMAGWSPEEFSARVLRDALHAQIVHVGADFRFGARATGDVARLAELGKVDGYDVRPFSLVGEGSLPRISSSAIRAMLAAGDVGQAAELLGRPYRLTGPVVRGDARGRGLGYPTANLRLPVDAVIPADAIYAGRLTVEKESWPAAISVGTNPTFEGVERRVEAYALDRDDLELYDRIASVDFCAYLRPTLRFDSVEQLIKQMGADVEQTRRTMIASG